MTVLKTDYSASSLQAAFTGQDVVISIVGPDGYASQKVIVDAAIAAGVKRFFPSEFGPLANSENVAFLPSLAVKRDLLDYLISKEESISWTAVQTGAFFDWGLKVGFLGFDLANRKANIFDGGHAQFHVTNVATIGQAVVATLSTPDRFERTKNQYVRVASHKLSQLEILAALERVTGKTWTVTDMDSEPLVKDAREKLASGAGGFEDAYALVRALFFSKVSLGLLGDDLWNEELGLPEEDLDAGLKAILV